MSWHPIETAPKDGTDILVWRDHMGIFLARFIAPSDFLTEQDLNEMGDGSYEPDWFAADYLAGCRLEADCAPTHWLPLPNPPKA